MYWIDSHAHIYSEKYENIDDVVEKAKKNNIESILMPNIDLSSISPMHLLSSKYPNYCYPMMGLHPCSVDADFEKMLHEIEKLLENNKYIAIGETGTDLYWSKEFWEEQQCSFLKQLDWSSKYQLPLVIHCRASVQQTVDLLKKNETMYGGVFHCFAGTEKQANEVIELGFYLGIGGVLTFKNSKLNTWIHKMPKDKILLETDSPYLAPSPYRGKLNQPSFLPLIGEKLSSIWRISPKEVANITTENAKKLFRINDYDIIMKKDRITL